MAVISALRNVALTFTGPLRVSVQLWAMPLHEPPQPENADFAAGVAVRVTLVPGAKFVAQVPGQLMPEGELLMLPLPEPEILNATRAELPFRP